MVAERELLGAAMMVGTKAPMSDLKAESNACNIERCLVMNYLGCDKYSVIASEAQKHGGDILS